MKKIVTALVAAATIAVAAMATSGTAEARYWGHGWRGPGPVIGGFVAGALVGSALAAPYYYPYGYYVRSVSLRTLRLADRVERIPLGARLLLRARAIEIFSQ